ncbi:MAG TPA: hypothetical protein VKV26_24010 [Dehalococcoidia bacterium]|nr:hypothetical protein [Dehalococcoidia bacterium]
MANRILSDPDGELPHITNESGWLVPAARPELVPVAPNGTTAEGAWLRWPASEQQRRVIAPKGLLFAFAALVAKPASAIRTFAARYGPLCLCLHRPLRASYLPFGVGFVEYAPDGSIIAAHPDGPLVFRDRDPDMRWCEDRHRPGICNNDRRNDGSLWESAAVWTLLAEQAGAILRCATAVGMGQAGDAADWAVIRRMLGAQQRPMPASIDPAVLRAVAEAVARSEAAALGDVDAWHELAQTSLHAGEAWRCRPDDPLSLVAAQATLCLAVSLWLDRGGVRPVLVLPLGNVDQPLRDTPRALPRQPAVRYGATNLIGAVALQLALALADVSAAPSCVICGEPYGVTRRPRANSMNICGKAACTRERDRLNQQHARARRRLSRVS